MTPQQLTDFCLALPGAWPDSPWENHTVAKVGPGEKGKIFAFLGEDRIGLKLGATREEADAWLAQYPEDASVMAYIGRHGWTDLRPGGAIGDDEILDAVRESWERVVAGLPCKYRPEAAPGDL